MHKNISSGSRTGSYNISKTYPRNGQEKEHQDDSIFDDDDHLKTRYKDREQALKRINEELEKKSSEIFRKIEKYGLHESPSARDYFEAGQGDAPSSDSGTDMRYIGSDIDRPKSASVWNSSPFLNPNGSYFNVSRVSSALSSLDIARPESASYYEHVYNNNFTKRPLTASASVNQASAFPNHTESSLRRAETARPISDDIEEKHQVRLQKATESVLKCVQSKLVNYEQRLADMHLQYRQKIQENTMLEAKVKALEDDRKRLLKSVQTLQSTTDKISKSAESSKMNLNLKAQAFASLRKEMESLKRDVKHKNGMVQSLQTRLDRSTEENRRMKSQHQSTQLNMKQQHNEDRTALEDLKQKITQLEQQKSSFQTTLEKQAQLIKSLRSQKVSLTNIVQKHKLPIDEINDLSIEDDEQTENA
ncbi:Testis-expressed sequence 9 protein [Orchesella cincta]|uniref:Testis-expressed sequence 9 protein n=1 Tax=Orchesella cincta TaxID=48709 RepID=A0A1D2NHX7_ORCCI|nr:Testis-expressed sequence 9 protein [Orchesella cincta]